MTQTIVTKTRLEKAIEILTMYTNQPIVTTLQGITSREKGITTRQVNYAVDELFKGNAVVCLDHKERGENDTANRGLFERVLRRLQCEHPGLVGSEYLIYNQLYGFIYLKT